MSEQHRQQQPPDPDEERRGQQPAPPPPVMRDPITGVTPAGPIQAGDAKAGRGGWSLAARWLIVAMLIGFMLLILFWIWRGW